MLTLTRAETHARAFYNTCANVFDFAVLAVLNSTECTNAVEVRFQYNDGEQVHFGTLTVWENADGTLAHGEF